MSQIEHLKLEKPSLAADVTQCDWVADLVPEGAFTNLDEVIGKGVTVPIAKGAPVCDLNFRTNDEQLEVPQGMVAVSVPLTRSYRASPVEVVAGSNVIAYATSDEGTTLVTEDVVVLSMPESSSIGAAATLTLAVSPDAVPVVLTASAEGTLRIVVPADDVDNTAGAVSGLIRLSLQLRKGKLMAEKWFACSSQETMPVLLKALEILYPVAVVRKTNSPDEARAIMLAQQPYHASLAVGPDCTGVSSINLAAAVVAEWPC